MPKVMEITTPLGPDALLFHSMHAREELSRVAEYRLHLLSPHDDINVDDILGKSVTIKLALPDDSIRYFNGYVTRFSHGDKYGKFRRYYAEVHSWLWFLSRTADCRIFQDMTVPDIVKKVFGEEGTNSFKLELTGKYRKWTYCVQYRETDLNFVSRLMEHEGIYFYVTHDDERHTIVVTDSYSGHDRFQDDPIPFIAPGDLVRPDLEHISEWSVAHQIQPGTYVHDDYDHERPNVKLRTQKAFQRTDMRSHYEVFDYPGYYAQRADGEQYASVRIEEFAAQYETSQGATNHRQMSVGSLFHLEKCPHTSQNGEHLVISTTHHLQFSDYEAVPERSGASYQCYFVTIPSKQQFRPKRLTPKPFVQGPQTAVVVGPAGEEIHTDKFGRVKVQFRWDRLGNHDENSSCWVRVSQPWAGKAWGGIAIPRVGHEVIVDFLEGDPDQPIITGRVYNGESRPPYELPLGGTRTTIKSYSSKGGGGFNEIRFEDKKGSEQVFLHAERNQDNRVKNDSLEWIGANRHLIVSGDQFEQVGGDKHLTVKGDQNEKVDGTVSLKTGMDLQQKIGMKHALDAGMEIHLKAGMNVVLEAGVQLTLKVGGNFIDLNPGGVFIQGTMVMINSGGAAGSGSGCSPAAPKPPSEADKAEPGEKAEVSASPAAAAAPTTPSPQAAVLRQAAATGVPFCEKCEEARRAQEAGQA